jgi:diacylglycerol kinase family enzyme
MRRGGEVAAFVVNGPRARRLGGLAADLAVAARASGWADPLVLMTSPGDGGQAAARQALAAGAQLVVAVGGDGTVRACAEVLADTGVPLAIVPAGTANLAARSLGLPRRPEAALAVALAGRNRPLDLALADNTISVSMAGIGVDASVVGGTSDRLKRQVGWPAYAVASAGHLLAARTEFAIALDGGTPFIRLARSVVVGNCGLLPGGFPLLPAARPDDGMLDVGILAPAGLADWASVGLRVLAASARDDRRLERHRARHVEISAAVRLPRQVDGEMISPAAALRVEIRPAALVVRVPV